MNNQLTEAIKICEEAGYVVEKSEWKPMQDEVFYYISEYGKVMNCKYEPSYVTEKGMIIFGNYFRTEQEATEARDKVEELLTNLKK